MAGDGQYFRKLGAKQGFAAGVRAMLGDVDLRRAAQSIDGVMNDDVEHAFERWWATQRRSRR
jgi:hypothetical protein